jgi:acyl-CoA thioester hydrolase
VRYPEVDRMGVAHHTHYLTWFELGRTEWLREQGVPYASLEEHDGVLLPVVEAGASYLAAARYDDELIVTTRPAWIRRVRMRIEYEIARAVDGTRLATGHTVHAAVDRAGHPRRIPPALARLFGESS